MLKKHPLLFLSLLLLSLISLNFLSGKFFNKSILLNNSLLPFPYSHVEEIKIQAGNHFVTLVKKDNLWTVKLKEQFTLGEQEKIKNFLEELSKLKSSGTISNNPSKYSTFEVENPPFKIQIKTAKDSVEFFLGKRGADFNSQYLRKVSAEQDPNVYLVEHHLDAYLNTDSDYWRDKKVFNLDSDIKLIEFGIKGHPHKIDCRKNKDWDCESCESEVFGCKDSSPQTVNKIKAVLELLTSLRAVSSVNPASLTWKDLDALQHNLSFSVIFPGIEDNWRNHINLSIGRKDEQDLYLVYTSTNSSLLITPTDWRNEYFKITQSDAEKLLEIFK